MYKKLTFGLVILTILVLVGGIPVGENKEQQSADGQKANILKPVTAEEDNAAEDLTPAEQFLGGAGFQVGLGLGGLGGGLYRPNYYGNHGYYGHHGHHHHHHHHHGYGSGSFGSYSNEYFGR